MPFHHHHKKHLLSACWVLGLYYQVETMKFKAIYVKLMVEVGKGNGGKNKSWN